MLAYIEMGKGHSSSVKLRYMIVLLSLHLCQVAFFFTQLQISRLSVLLVEGMCLVRCQ